MVRKRFCLIICLFLWAILILGGCGGSPEKTATKGTETELTPGNSSPGKVSGGNTGGVQGTSGGGSGDSTGGSGDRESTPVVLVPEASGETVYENEWASMDASHMEDGYVMVQYKGNVEKVKLQTETPEGVTYTMRTGYEVFPLTGGNGDYTISVWEQRPASGDYLNVFNQSISVTIKDAFSPYLYPNQYVNFSEKSKVVELGAELVEGASDDLDAVTRIFTYVTENISYDTDKAQNVQSGYLPDVDEVLESGKGICFDYAVVMASMLRTQRIPTRLEIGYAGDVYHAWISTHIDGVGWVNGIIQFDGSEWQLMDPTFAANSSSDSLRDFISEGDNYQTKFIY